MTPQQIDQKVDLYLQRALRLKSFTFKNVSLAGIDMSNAISVAKLIQEEEHFQQLMEEKKKLNK